jgi:hypothetical protein
LLFLPLRAPSRADPSGLGHAATIYSSVQGPPGVETPTIVYLVEDTTSTISEAYSSPDADFWKEAVRSEMESIMSNGTWEVVDRPYGCQPIGCK